MKRDSIKAVNRGLATDPQWYKDAIIYEVRVRSFYDSGGDGIGDFQGLTQRLDYLQRLGVTALWLLPFYPSPQRDDGYDISDYMDVHPDCGTLRDFKNFLKEAHHRGLYVVTELVLNHTSDQHPWFQRARLSTIGSVERDFYVWSDTIEKYRDARIIFWGLRALKLVMGPGGQGILLASIFQSPARFEFRQSRSSSSDVGNCGFLARDGR
jgi:pullulanase/glycogen debranching enzyme